MKVMVRDDNVDKAIKVLKRKLQREGLFREMRDRQFYSKPSERKAVAKAAAKKRHAKSEKQRIERDQ